MEPPPSVGTAPSVWVGVGPALTHGLPDALSVAGSVELGARRDSYEIWAGALVSPGRELPFGPGFVELSANGGHARGCTALLAGSELRWNGCVVGLLLALRGKARGFTTNSSEVRPWWLVGAGTELGWSLASWFELVVSGRLLISVKEESFSIDGLPGTAYTTDLAVGWVGALMAAKIW